MRDIVRKGGVINQQGAPLGVDCGPTGRPAFPAITPIADHTACSVASLAARSASDAVGREGAIGNRKSPQLIEDCPACRAAAIFCICSCLPIASICARSAKHRMV